jgi:hypothetical protein
MVLEMTTEHDITIVMIPERLDAEKHRAWNRT